MSLLRFLQSSTFLMNLSKNGAQPLQSPRKPYNFRNFPSFGVEFGHPSIECRVLCGTKMVQLKVLILILDAHLGLADDMAV